MAYQQGRNNFPPRPVPEALGQTIKTINLEDLNQNQSHGAYEIRDCEYIASFNLPQALSSSISIPGRPPRWTPTPYALSLARDNLRKYRDPVAARFPDHPLDPIIKSVCEQDINFQPGDTDIVIGGRTVDNLLSLAKNEGEEFSIVAQVIGETLFLVPRFLSPIEQVNIQHGNGQAFLAQNTTWDVGYRDSSSHQRMVTYMLADKKFLVRFEVDAYLPDATNEGQAEAGAATGADLNEDPRFDTDAQAPPSDQHIPQSALIDIKIRSQMAANDGVLAKQLLRLWARQVSHLVLAFHTRGRFEPPTVENVDSALQKWQSDNIDSIARMMAGIDAIKHAAERADGKILEVRGSDGGKLSFIEIPTAEQGKWQALSAEYRELWAKGE